MNHEKQVVYWRESAEEDWEVGRSLVQQDKTRHGLFFVHLALEKILKAHVSRATEDIPPRIHNLMRLVEIGRVSLTDEQRGVRVASSHCAVGCAGQADRERER